MNAPNRRHLPKASKIKSGSSEKIELDRLIEGLREKVLQSPGKAARILTRWIDGRPVKEQSNQSIIKKKAG